MTAAKEKPSKPEATVAAVSAVTGVSVAPETVALKVGQTQQLTATVEPEDAADKTVSWSTSDDTIAMVDGQGLVDTVAEGSATVTVTTVDGAFTASSQVTVEPLPVVDLSLLVNDNFSSNRVLRKSSIYLNIEDITLEANQTAKLLQTPEGFVLERIDMAVIKAPAMALALKFATDSDEIASFTVEEGSTDAVRVAVTGKQAGDYLPVTWINLINLGSRPQGDGKLAVSFIGYLIEPWR